MADEGLPLIAIRRVLIPGTAVSLPAPGPGGGVGEEAVAVFAPPGRPPSAARVGTRALVEAARPLGPGVRLLRLRGIGLVRLVATHGEGRRRRAEVAELPEPGGGGRELVEAVERALRRYLALRAEAGEEVGPSPGLSRDPVQASHEVASRLRISWPEVQEICEAGSAADRLCRERAVLDREAELLRRLLGREGA